MRNETIQISVNGEGRDVPGGLSLLDLLGRFGLDPAAVVVELNREIVRRPALPATPVRDGDSLELVHFVGGG
jgi:sulfur carrier protein